MSLAGRSVTIAVPVKDGAAYLEPALNSAVAQVAEWPRTEIVVHDNASTDETADIAARFAGQGVRCVRHDTPVSMGENWNRALHAARTDYLVLLHADDVLLPGMVARAARVLDAAPETGFCFGASRYIDAEGRATGEHRPFAHTGPLPRHAFLPRHLRNNFIHCPTTMFRVQALRGSGLQFRGDLRQLLDWHLLLRLQFAGWTVGYVAELQAEYRVHDRNATAANVHAGGIWDEIARVWHDLAALPDLPPWARRPLGVVFARLAARHAVAAVTHDRQPAGASLGQARHALRRAAGYLGWRVLYHQPEQLAWAVMDDVRRRRRAAGANQRGHAK